MESQWKSIVVELFFFLTNSNLIWKPKFTVEVRWRMAGGSTPRIPRKRPKWNTEQLFKESQFYRYDDTLLVPTKGNRRQTLLSFPPLTRIFVSHPISRKHFLFRMSQINRTHASLNANCGGKTFDCRFPSPCLFHSRYHSHFISSLHSAQSTLNNNTYFLHEH